MAFGSITLRRSQVAVGFVLTLFCRDLAYFLGNPFMGEGPAARRCTPSRCSEKIPILGTLFFKHDIMTYFSFVLIIVAWWWIFRTRPGLMLRAVGERPAAAFARGAKVNLVRYIYTVARRRAGGPGRPHVLAERQGRLEGHHLRAGRPGLDRAGHRHLRGLEPGAGGLRRLPLRPAAVAERGAAARASRASPPRCCRWPPSRS